MSTKTIGFLIEYNYEDLEFWYPYLRFQEAGMKTIVIGTKKGNKYESKHGLKGPVSDEDGSSVKAEDLDCLIVPGGWAPDYMRRDRSLVALVKTMADSGKIVGTICHGAWMLCSARVIKGKRLTCFHAIRDDVENAGGLYEDSPVVEDGNLVTSRFPDDLPHFCKTLLRKLES